MGRKTKLSRARDFPWGDLRRIMGQTEGKLAFGESRVKGIGRQFQGQGDGRQQAPAQGIDGLRIGQKVFAKTRQTGGPFVRPAKPPPVRRSA